MCDDDAVRRSVGSGSSSSLHDEGAIFFAHDLLHGPYMR